MTEKRLAPKCATALDTALRRDSQGIRVAMQPQQAFTRARRFLQFHKGAARGAIGAGLALGLVYLCYLALAGLLTDLLATGGRLTHQQTPQLVAWLDANVAGPERQRLLQAHQRGEGVGLIALAVRNQDAWSAGLFNTLARNLPWTWKPLTYLTGLLAIFLFLGLAHFAVALLMNHWAVAAVLDAAYRLRRTVYLHSLRLGRLAIEGVSGAAISTFTRDLEMVQDGLHAWLTVSFKETAQFLVALLFALAVDSVGGLPWITVITVLVAGLFWLLAGRVASKYRVDEKRETAAAAEQMGIMREALSLNRLVKAFGMDAFNQNRLERQLHAYGRHQQARIMTRARSRLALQTLALMALAALVLAVGWAILTDQKSWAQAVSCLLALGVLYLPLRRLLRRQQQMEQVERSAAALFRFLDREGDVRQVVGAEFLAPMTTSLEFDQVTLKDPAQPRPLLSQVSFKVNAGERIAFVGEDEQAKRAIAYLIPRFLDPTQGEIRIDGRRLPWMTLESIRAQVGLILLSDLVYSDSVQNNIACGDPDLTLPKVIEAAKAAHAHQFIQNLPAGYETLVGELGTPLAIGEKFRIALARVILRDPAIVIIEEPPHTALDDDTQVLLDDAIDQFLVGRTAIFLPHRQSTTRSANRVYLIHDGKIEAIGAHRELLQNSERYRHLQYLEYNVFAEES